jgi:hypothetical protein
MCVDGAEKLVRGYVVHVYVPNGSPRKEQRAGERKSESSDGFSI